MGDKEKAIKIHETILETVNIIFNSNTMKEWDYYFSKNTSKKA